MHVRRNFASSIRMGGNDTSEIRAAQQVVVNGLNISLTVGGEACPSDPCSSQRGSFVVNAAAAARLFGVMPFIAPDGSLVFSLRPSTSGEMSFTVTFSDDGGGTTGGQNSTQQPFSIKILAINDPPVYRLLTSNIMVPPYAMPQDVRNFLQNISVGPPDEASQTFIVKIHVQDRDLSLFAAGGLPRYRRYSHSLFFIPAGTTPTTSVSIQVRLEMQDTGGNFRPSVAAWTPRPANSDNSTITAFNITFVGAAPSAITGQSWSKMTTAHIPASEYGVVLTPRLGHALVEFMGDIWVLGGYLTPPENASEPWRGSRRLLDAHNPDYLLSDVWRLQQVTAGLCRDAGLCLSQTRVQTAAAWSGRHSHAAVVLGNRMWVMGGVTAHAGPVQDVWSSYDGVVWDLVTAAAGWAPRFSMAIDTIADPSGSDDASVMIITGGHFYTGSYSTTSDKNTYKGSAMYNDVWSSTDGKHWQLLQVDAGWTPRAGHAMTSLRGPQGNVTLFLAGGEEVTGTTKRDVWYSKDSGASWQLLTDAAPWRDRAGHAMLRYGGRLLLVSGRSSAPVNIDLDSPILRDVWVSSNGYVWEKVLGGEDFGSPQVVGESPFEGREHFGAVVHGLSDKLVLFGGQGLQGRLGDVWVSPKNTI
jgi:hypothetical protein